MPCDKLKTDRAPKSGLTKREPSRRLKQSSITTSSSFPRISEILPAIHLRQTQGSISSVHGSRRREGNSLLHDLDVDLGHVDLLVELGRELGLFDQLGIDARRHGGQTLTHSFPPLRQMSERRGERDRERVRGAQWHAKLLKSPRLAFAVSMICRSPATVGPGRLRHQRQFGSLLFLRTLHI